MDGLSAAASGMERFSDTTTVKHAYCLKYAGIAVVQIAGQLVVGFIQLYDFWVTVQGAPDDIKDLVTELDCLTTLLKEIANEQHHGHGMIIAMQCCERKIKVIDNTHCGLSLLAITKPSRSSSTLCENSNQISALSSVGYASGTN